MKISLNWIREFTEIPAKFTAKMLAELLTLRTCEVEGYEDEGVKFANMVVGRVAALRPHPNADKLRLVDTDIGGHTVQIVCGGQNLKENMLVAVALPGSLVKWHGEGDLIELKEAKIRGETSVGMICAEEEIGLPVLTPPEGITIANLAYHADAQKLSAGMPLAAALGMHDIILEIDNKSITHRPDLWGHYGMAREFSSFLGKKLLPYEKAAELSKTKFPAKGASVKVRVQNKAIAPRFCVVAVSGVTIQESPVWLKNRLAAVGMRPVNNVVDATNYVMLELGQPMHAFDRAAVGTDLLDVRYAHEGEVLETLDHKKRSLSKEDAVIGNGERLLGLAGIMGGLDSEISRKTTEIIFEAANWNPVMIRKTSSRHGLRSDAAQRFEKGLDPMLCDLALKRACELLLQICPGARKAGPITDVWLEKPKAITVTVKTGEIISKIGTPVATAEMVKHLEALGFAVKRGPKETLRVLVPSFRATKDIHMEDDIVEEVARMHGYENITPHLPELPIKLPRENKERALKHRARQILSLALGFSETNRYSFYGKAEMKKAELPESVHLQIENPLTEDQTHMRVSLIPNMLKSVADNLNRADSFRLYEVGKTYIKSSGFFPQEEKFIAGVMVSTKKNKDAPPWRGNNGLGRPRLGTASSRSLTELSLGLFYDALGALEAFLKRFGAPAWSRVESAAPPPYAHPAKCVELKIGHIVALAYELHPQVLRNFDIAATVGAFEINFTRLVAAGQPQRNYRPLPRFPGIEIDVSVLVEEKTPVAEIQNLMKISGGELVTSIHLIDIFKDKNLGEGKKSFTFRLLLQSPDRTLTDEEMKQVQEKVVASLQKNGFTVRG